MIPKSKSKPSEMKSKSFVRTFLLNNAKSFHAVTKYLLHNRESIPQLNESLLSNIRFLHDATQFYLFADK